jgi:hypothetical protein
MGADDWTHKNYSPKLLELPAVGSKYFILWINQELFSILFCIDEKLRSFLSIYDYMVLLAQDNQTI